jgi:hypothetical protein
MRELKARVRNLSEGISLGVNERGEWKPRILSVKLIKIVEHFSPGHKFASVKFGF